MVGALATGNCVVLKASQQVAHTAAVMEKILESFPRELILMINGDHSVSEQLLSYKFDYIFFTGSSRIGKHVMQKASENLIPVSLELGGKNPCIVAEDAMIGFAARRIAWGKFMNAGQTCICTDYVLIDKKIKTKFLEKIIQEVRSFYGEKPEDSKDFARIVNKENVIRLCDGLGQCDVFPRSVGAPLQFDRAVGQPLRPDQDLPRNADQISGGEFGAGALIGVVVQYVDALGDQSAELVRSGARLGAPCLDRGSRRGTAPPPPAI